MFSLCSHGVKRSKRRFPPPWTVKKLNEDCFAVQDANGVSLAFIYSRDDLHKQRWVTTTSTLHRMRHGALRQRLREYRSYSGSAHDVSLDLRGSDVADIDHHLLVGRYDGSDQHHRRRHAGNSRKPHPPLGRRVMLDIASRQGRWALKRARAAIRPAAPRGRRREAPYEAVLGQM
jgi:hypothetical protein